MEAGLVTHKKDLKINKKLEATLTPEVSLPSPPPMSTLAKGEEDETLSPTTRGWSSTKGWVKLRPSCAVEHQRKQWVGDPAPHAFRKGGRGDPPPMPPQEVQRRVVLHPHRPPHRDGSPPRKRRGGGKDPHGFVPVVKEGSTPPSNKAVAASTPHRRKVTATNRGD